MSKQIKVGLFFIARKGSKGEITPIIGDSGLLLTFKCKETANFYATALHETVYDEFVVVEIIGEVQ